MDGGKIKRASKKLKRKFSLADKLERKSRKKLKKQKSDASIAGSVTDVNKKKSGQLSTVSIALPGSILENSQSPELRTYLAGQIARAAVIFNVDEIIIFNESLSKKTNEGLFKGSTKSSDPNILLARILQYLECPQYLRKEFFPVHQDLKYAGILNPLDCPHHMRADDIVAYREGVTLNRPVKKGEGSFVNVGVMKDVKIDKHLKPNIRVTVKLDPYEQETIEKKRYLTGRVVTPSTPREETGIYWGYSVRLAENFSSVFTNCPYKGGYDLTIGTSENGADINSIEIPSYNHLLLVFGGSKGLEYSFESEESLRDTDVSLLFDHFINYCSNQGTRTVRTEEAVLITLAVLRSKLSKT
ncbi:putative methyltransferase C9orf114 homolog isoform X2 [Hydra vulgaris]|uniref:Methyltransferase C9orf114 homolog isoform X2 n=1 Tax=Hydra vulgaris TaxID=6087 RepID=A0ABM4BBF0_HYDVU